MRNLSDNFSPNSPAALYCTFERDIRLKRTCVSLIAIAGDHKIRALLNSTLQISPNKFKSCFAFGLRITPCKIVVFKIALVSRFHDSINRGSTELVHFAWTNNTLRATLPRADQGILSMQMVCHELRGDAVSSGVLTIRMELYTEKCLAYFQNKEMWFFSQSTDLTFPTSIKIRYIDQISSEAKNLLFPSVFFKVNPKKLTIAIIKPILNNINSGGTQNINEISVYNTTQSTTLTLAILQRSGYTGIINQPPFYKIHTDHFLSIENISTSTLEKEFTFLAIRRSFLWCCAEQIDRASS